MPYETLVAGNVVTASWANASVRDQVVTPFATAAARTSAVSAPVEGMLSYLADSNKFEGYTGTQWLSLAGGPRVMLTRAANQSINNNSLTNISWDTEVTDPEGMIAVTNATVTLNSAGLWLVIANITFAVNGTGDRILVINQNGSEVGGQGGPPMGTANTHRLSASQILNAAASDTVTIGAFQNSGGAVNVTGRLSIVRVG